MGVEEMDHMQTTWMGTGYCKRESGGVPRSAEIKPSLLDLDYDSFFCGYLSEGLCLWV